MPVTVLEVLQFLKLDESLESDPTVNAQITLMIESAIDEAEKITKKTFQRSEFLGYWDSLTGGEYPYELRKFPFQSLTSISYNVAGSTSSFDVTKIEEKKQDGFSRLQPKYGESWPSSSSGSIAVNDASIVFEAGYDDGELPSQLKQALLLHIGSLWVNRGDCVDSSSKNSSCSNIPSIAMNIYLKNAIIDLWIGA